MSPERNFKLELFFYHQNPQDTLAIYYAQQSGVSMKLSAMLNDLPAKIRRKMDETTLDSIFRNFFFPSSQINAYKIRLLSTSDSIYINEEMCLSKYNDATFHTNTRNNLLCNNFKNYVWRNCGRNNFFIYDAPSLLTNGDNLVITINEDLISDSSLSENKFYEQYDNEPILYNIRIYSLFRLE